MLEELTRKVASGAALSREEAQGALGALFEEATSDIAIACFLTALSVKGETAQEIAGFAQTMREFSVKLDAPRADLVDTAGTGGGVPSFNVSTTAAFVIAGAGIAVAKHGNRAATSRSGSADLLEALGVRIDASLETVQRCFDRNGLAFLFAPAFHPAMKRVAGIRKQIPHRTIFNLLGPLTNPAGAPFQVIGVFDPQLADSIARALYLLGTKRSWVVHSLDGLDEISVRAPTRIAEVTQDAVREFELDPTDYGFHYQGEASPESKGGDPETNARLCLEILKGKRRDDLSDLVVMNAAAAIHLAADISLIEALEQAEVSISSGSAYRKLQELVETSTL